MRRVHQALPPLNKTDLGLLQAIDRVTGFSPDDRQKLYEYPGHEFGNSRDAYLMARHQLEMRLRALCRLANEGKRAMHGLKKQYAIQGTVTGRMSSRGRPQEIER